MNAFRDLTGMTFNRWTVVARASNSPHGQVRWRCCCSCGHVGVVVGSTLVSGRSKSCGCWNSEAAAKRARQRNHKHGHTSREGISPEYSSWVSMKGRCEYECVNSYELYGGRGIDVCDRWKNSFENFLADMGPKPSPQHSIDRIDGNKEYEPGNCRWSTALEQRHNRRSA